MAKFCKVVRVMKNGDRVSSYIDFNWGSQYRLTYRPNEIISAPPNSIGIFLYPYNLLNPLHRIAGNVAGSKNQMVEVYEAIPITEVRENMVYSNSMTAMKVKIGKLIETSTKEAWEVSKE